MHKAPAVYVPTKPEGNGLTLPTLLSLLAHGLVIGILIYTNHNTEIETAGSIETVMVSPEQLAEMQGQILANRAAAASEMQTENNASSVPSTMQAESFDSNASAQSPSQPNSQRVPVFMKSERSISENHNAEMEAFNRQMEQDANDRIQAPRDEKNKNYLAEQEKLVVLKEIEDNPSTKNANKKNPMISKSSKGGISIGNGSEVNNNPISLENNGEPTSYASNTNSSSAQTSSDSEVRALIRDNFVSPNAAKGKSATTLLTITVASNGVITGVSADGTDSIFDQAVEDAAWLTKKLPIGPGDPKYPTFGIQYNGSTK